MSNEQKLRAAFELGWKMAANWSLSDHLLADMESPAYLTERDGLLQALATTEPEPTGMPELHPVAHIELGDDSHDVVTLEAAKAYGEQCWKAGYKHGAWDGDARDAARYRWLASSESDVMNAKSKDHQWSVTDAWTALQKPGADKALIDAAIDAAMAKGVKG